MINHKIENYQRCFASGITLKQRIAKRFEEADGNGLQAIKDEFIRIDW